MLKDSKTLIIIISVTVVIVVGMAFLFSGSSNGADDSIEEPTVEAVGIELNPEYFGLGEVDINGGVVKREYEVKNVTDGTIKLKKLATSCMCTQAKVIVGDKETKFFGMEGHGDKNPPVNMEIAAGETAKVYVEFDPAAHGPQGVGPFDRIIWLTFSDPAGIKELKFDGTVVSS